MALRPRAAFAALPTTRPKDQPDGAWWPRSRSLSDELPAFFVAWPAARGRIHRILFSSPDWDDYPHSVVVGDRRVKTGTFPRDDTRILTVCMEDRSDHLIQVIPPTTHYRAAKRVLQTFDPAETTASHTPTPPPSDGAGGTH